MSIEIPDLVCLELIKYLDAKTLLNLSACSKRLFYLTKSAIEDKASIVYKLDQDFVHNGAIMRKYKSVTFRGIHPSNKIIIKYLIKLFRGNEKTIVEKISLSGCIQKDYFYNLLVSCPNLKELLIDRLEFDLRNEKANYRINCKLEVLKLNDFKYSLEVFKKCCNLSTFHYSIDKKCDWSMELTYFLMRQTCLKSLRISSSPTTRKKLVQDISKKVKYRLSSFAFDINVYQPCINFWNFILSQNDLKFLEINLIMVVSAIESFRSLENVLVYIFSLKNLETLIFKVICGQIRITQDHIFRRVADNRNMKVLKMPVTVEGDAEKVLRKFLAMYPSIEELEFGVGQNFSEETFYRINSLANLKKLKISNCTDAKFELSNVKIGGALEDFSYTGCDLKLIEWQNFFKIHKRLKHLHISVKDSIQDENGFVNSLLEMQDLRTIDLDVGISDEHKTVIEQNLKYLYHINW